MRPGHHVTRIARAVPALAFVLIACSPENGGNGSEHRTGAPAFERGPHGGLWLEDGAFALELTIFEGGGPPEFRAFVFRDEKPVDPSGTDVEVTLHRLGERIDRIRFAPRGDHLLGDRMAREPHSFDVEVVAREGGNAHRFRFSSYENRVQLTPEQQAIAGIRVALSGPATIREHIVLNGRIAPGEDALVRVMPRFPGVVRSVHRRLGDSVERGDLLATIEGNESLRAFEVRASLAGTVIAKNVAPGELVTGERELFQIADLDDVRVDLDVHRSDLRRLRVGQPLRVDPGDGTAPVETRLTHLAPIGSVGTQTVIARAVLPNTDRRWRPGLFVTAEVEVGVTEVPVAVSVEALQRLRERDAVFLAAGDVFEARPVELGRRDATSVEVVSGLDAGMPYVAAGSFVLKAETGKTGATHDH